MASASEAWKTCCLFVPGVVLHGYAFVSPHWINYNSKSEYFKGVAYRSGCLDDGGEGKITFLKIITEKNMFLHSLQVGM